MPCSHGWYYISLFRAPKGGYLTRLTTTSSEPGAVYCDGPFPEKYARQREQQLLSWAGPKLERVIKTSRTRCRMIRERLKAYELGEQGDTLNTAHELARLLGFLRSDAEDDALCRRHHEQSLIGRS